MPNNLKLSLTAISQHLAIRKILSSDCNAYK